MRVNLKKQRYLRFFGPFPLRGRGMTVYPSGRVVRDVSFYFCLPKHDDLRCCSCVYHDFCFRHPEFVL